MANNEDLSKYRWDLSFLYKDLNDPTLGIDIERLNSLYSDFRAKYRGRLKENLREALEMMEDISKLESKIYSYPALLTSLDVKNSPAKKKMSEIEILISDNNSKISFFELEICAIPDEYLASAYREDLDLLRLKPYIDKVRLYKDNLLSEEVESALSKRASFGAGAWGEFYDQFRSSLVIKVGDREMNMTEAGNLIVTSPDRDKRYEAMRAINTTFDYIFKNFSAKALYMKVGANALELKERGYKTPMEVRNRSSKLSDKTVDVLHSAVMKEGSALAKRYYKIRAKMEGLDVLRWSDKNAPSKSSKEVKIDFAEAIEIVKKGYYSFSPTLGSIVDDLVASNSFDIAPLPNKKGGGFNYTMVIDSGVHALTFMNYMGAFDHVLTLAHEVGHGVHGILGGRAQGPLMYHSGMAFAETASVFGELIVFNDVKSRVATQGDKEALITLLVERIQSILSTTSHQIVFSNFERRIHGMDASYSKWSEPNDKSPEEMADIWNQVRQEAFGPQGEIIDYTDSENLWASIPHFYSPFYVYSYAFGEILTHSLYKKKEELGDKFEALYIDFLSAGGSKSAKDMLLPFGLDPEDESMWTEGIKMALEPLIDELENLVSTS